MKKILLAAIVIALSTVTFAKNNFINASTYKQATINSTFKNNFVRHSDKRERTRELKEVKCPNKP